MRFSIAYIFASVMLALALLSGQQAQAATRTLERGMSGSDVLAVQQNLKTLGYFTVVPNGYFGPVTLSAVERFQCAKSVVCTGDSDWGVVGPKTQGAIQIALAPSQPAQIDGTMTPAATGKFEISGWVPDWLAASGTIDVAPHLAQMTSVMPFGFTMSADGQVTDYGNLGQDPWTTFDATAKAAHTRVVPSIEWGNGAQTQAILSDTTKRIALENEIANLVKTRGYDGIDIDFEAKQADTINYFATFLRGLYERMGNKWVYCTMEARMPLQDRYLPGQTIPPDATQYANNFIAMNKYCDRVEIMAYDQGVVDVRLDAARTAPYAPVADPGWVEDLVRLAAQTISRNKIILGIPDYGYEYSVVPQGNGTYLYTSLGAFNPPYALKLAQKLGITPGRTSADEIGFVYNPQSSLAAGPSFANPSLGADATPIQNPDQAPTSSVAQNLSAQSAALQQFNFVTWSDAQAVADKVALAHTLGLRGVAVFSLGGSEDQGIWNVLK